MKKKYRLKKEKDFKDVFYAKHSKANKQCVVYYLEKKDQLCLRTGISVSKKLGNAVVRNGIKRKIRRAIYELRELFYENYDIIVIARQPMVEMSVHDIKKSLYHVLNLCHLIKNKNHVEDDSLL